MPRSIEAKRKHAAHMRTFIIPPPQPITRKCGGCETVMCLPARGRRSRQRFCSQQCANRTTAGEGRAPKVRVALTCEHCGEPFIVRGNERHHRFCSVKCKARWQALLPYDQWRGKLSAATANRPRGAANPAWGKSPAHGHWHTYEGPNGVIRMRSSWELIAAEYLDMMGISWAYEGTRFALVDRTYCPDFWLPTLGAFWEVKGWFHAKHRETIRQFRVLNPEIPLVVMGEISMRAIARRVGLPLCA